jgi:HAD superfamily hydrolase (TIGR01548 family)
MKQKYDGIIFDMDGVLITNDAYCLAIQKTVEILLWSKFGLKKPITTEYITEIKKITGFNNDWDTSYALVELLGNKVPVSLFSQTVKTITPLIRLTPVYQRVKTIFQNLFLGKNFDGFILQEYLLIEKPVLQQLSQRFLLGIATSRPNEEAFFAATNLQLSPTYIPLKYIVAKQDTKREKPYPDPLLEAKRRMNATNPIYIGDTINDVIAAKSAGMKCVFIGKQNLGDLQLSNVNQLQEVLL